ncbi:MAG TPA: DCC1-like thiol-disulfide oxidoreductase family protein [Candidatus Thermoplasmatota archaeon]
MADERGRVELLFDGRCASCGAFASAVRMLDTERRIEFTPLQDAAARRRLEGRMGDAYWASFHLVGRDGRTVRSGADALPELAQLLPAVRPFAAALFRTPGLRRLPAAAYEAAAFARACALPHEHS